MGFNIFPWDSIDHKQKTTGFTKCLCPVCSHTRTHKKTEKCLYVHYTDGVAKCHHCEALSFRDGESKVRREKEYVLPSQDWKNYTQLSDGLIKYLEEERGIKQFTVQALGWTEEKVYQPAAKAVRNSLVFNYFEQDTLVNKKYRTRDKHFTQSQGTKSILYNINSAVGAEEVWICEGELDLASLFQEGIKNIVSVPNGANNNDEYWLNSEAYLTSAKKFIIATDMDEKGEALAEKIAHRLGKWRCERVIFEGNDANADLKSGVLSKSMQNRNVYPVTGTLTISEIYDDIIHILENGMPSVIRPKNISLGVWEGVFAFMLGHLCTVTGIPSHGKSAFTEWLAMVLLAENDNLKLSLYSPEHQPVALHQLKLASKFIGKPYDKKKIYHYPDGSQIPYLDRLDIAKYAEWANERIYTTTGNPETYTDWDWLLSIFKQQIFRYGINVFIVDAWNKVELPSRLKGNSVDNINSALTMITDFCIKNNVLVILVAHPTKMKKENGAYEIPDLYSVSGSAHFRNQTHDGYVIYRYFPCDEHPKGKTLFINAKTKFSDIQGEIGKDMGFYYEPSCGRYYHEEQEPDFKPLLDVTTTGIKKRDIANDLEPVEPSTHIPKMSLAEAFPDSEADIFKHNEQDDVPF